jgi:hypothetical protein
MPAKSKAQYRLMQLAKHNPDQGAELGIAPSVAKEFTQTYNKNMPQHVPKSSGSPKARVDALKAIKP